MEELQQCINATESDNVSNWCVYMHINVHNNKVYIGITNDIKQRWQKQGGKYKAKNKDGT
jgi:predicted GIY-YIG superfamily endonuclease